MAVGLGLVHGALDPVHLREIDPVIVLQQAAHEDRGRHRIERNADALAGEILRRADHAAIDRDIAMAEHARGKHRQRHERTVAGGEAGDEFRARHLRGIELLRARHAVENLARAVDGEEVEIDALGLHLLGVERQHAVVEAAGEGDLDVGHRLGFPRGAGRFEARHVGRNRFIAAIGVADPRHKAARLKRRDKAIAPYVVSPLSASYGTAYSPSIRLPATAAISRIKKNVALAGGEHR